jgi:hypothetical protein
VGTVDSPTQATNPPHLACLLCRNRPEFFSFYWLFEHYRKVHPAVLARREWVA